jgi:hypothetical protein
METTETSRLIEMQLANGSAKETVVKTSKNDLVLKHFDEFYFYARLLKINILKNKNKRMKPLESKDPDLFTISVQFFSEFAWNLQKHSENIGFRTYIFKRNSIDKHDSLKKLTSPLLHCVLCSAKALKSITRAKVSVAMLFQKGLVRFFLTRGWRTQK